MFAKIFFNDEYRTQSALEIDLRVRDREKQLTLLAIENEVPNSKISKKKDDPSKALAKGSLRSAQILHRRLISEK